MKIALIPARGGSKRIPRKNIRTFRELPMIAWSIRAAQLAGCFDRIIISTEDEQIAGIARNHGAEVPFMRPKELADDYTTTQAVIGHAINWFESNGLELDAICCIYPTAPFVQPEDLAKGLQILESDPKDSFVFTATSFSFPIQRAVEIDKSGRTRMFYPEFFKTRSQDLKEAFHDAGQFYWAQPQVWLRSKNLFEDGKPLILPRWRVQDIDTEEDWKRAELLHQVIEKVG